MPALALTLALAACGKENTYRPPPPAEVTVAKPESRKVTLYMEVTGVTAPVNRVDLVARVQGFLDTVGYKDGAFVKKGDVLFQIDKKDYEIALEIAQAAQEQQEALLIQANADLERKENLVKTAATSVALLDESRAKRDSTQAALSQAKGQVEQARRNLEYTTIVAPFDGVMTARLVDPGSMVGAGSPTKLATLVQVDPIYVNFSIDEQQVLTVRARLRSMGVTLRDIGPVEVDIGLQTEEGYPHAGTLDYISPEIDSSTGTLAGRAVLPNTGAIMQAGLFARVRIPKQKEVPSLLVPDVALGNNQEGRYLLVVNDKNVVEQRQVETGEQVDGTLRIIKSGLSADDRVVVAGIQRALPGATVVPITAAAAAAEDAAATGEPAPAPASGAPAAESPAQDAPAKDTPAKDGK